MPSRLSLIMAELKAVKFQLLELFNEGFINAWKYMIALNLLKRCSNRSQKYLPSSCPGRTFGGAVPGLAAECLHLLVMVVMFLC